MQMSYPAAEHRGWNISHLLPQHVPTCTGGCAAQRFSNHLVAWLKMPYLQNYLHSLGIEFSQCHLLIIFWAAQSY